MSVREVFQAMVLPSSEVRVGDLVDVGQGYNIVSSVQVSPTDVLIRFVRPGLSPWGGEEPDEMQAVLRLVDPDLKGVWIAYYSDASRIEVFATEIDCLRVAVDGHMQYKFVKFGEQVFP